MPAKKKKVVLKKKVTKKPVAKKAAKKPVKKAAKKVSKKTKKTVKKVSAPVLPKIDGKKVGVVTHWYGHISVAIFKLSAPLSVGDKIALVRGEEVLKDTVKSMQFDHKSISSAKKGQEIGVQVKKHAHEGALVYKLD